MKTFLRKFGIFAIVFVMANLFFSSAVFGQETVQEPTGPEPTVTLDQADLDYAPGETVYITGSGWKPGEVVTLEVDNLTNPDVDCGIVDPEPHILWTTVADGAGNFTASWYVNDCELGADLFLEAFGRESGFTFEIFFTDGPNTPNITTVSPSSASIGETVSIILNKNVNSITSVKFGTTSASFTFPNGNNQTIAVVIPSGTGTVNLTVTGTETGTGNPAFSDTKNNAFTYCSAPTLSCPSNVNLVCNGIVPAGANTITDFITLGGSTNATAISYSDAVASVGCVETTTRTYTATIGTCFITCQQIITRTVDILAPTVTTAEGTDANIGCNPDAAAIEAAFTAPVFGDNCSTPSVEVATVHTGTGCSQSDTRTWTASDVCSGLTTSVSQEISYTIDILAPTVITQNISINLNSSGSASITVAQINDGSTDNCSIASKSLSKTDFNCSNVGLNTVILTVTDGCGNSASKDAVVTVNVPTTTVALVSAPSVRYMDEVTLYAEVESNCGVTSLAGNVDFYLCGVLVGSAPAYPIPVGETGNPNKLRATLLHKVTNDPNTCVVEAVFKSSTPYYLDSPKASTNLIIKQREATYAATGTGNPGNFFCGQSFYWTPTETSNSANVLLNATIVDANTPTGDVRGARVTFYYVNGGVYTPIPSATNLPVNLVNLLDGTVGTVSKSVVLSISGNANSESFTIAVGVSGAYFNRKEAPTSIALITVSKPVKGGFVCGGGTIVNSANTNGWVRGVVGQSTSFSMDLKFNNTKNTAPQGKINNIIFWSWYKPDGTLDNVMHQYEAKSTSITTFVVGKPTVKDAYFTSKANLVEIVNGQSVGIEGNATLQVEMSDLGASGSGFDKIAITIFRKAGGVWLSTEWNGGKTILRNINTGLIGGNIYVSTAGQAQTARIANPITSKQVKEIPVVESVPFNVIAYPNPAKYQFTLVVEGGSKEKVGVMVYDVLGRTVKRIESTDGQPIQFGEELPTGAYFTIVSQGANQKTVRLIKE